MKQGMDWFTMKEIEEEEETRSSNSSGFKQRIEKPTKIEHHIDASLNLTQRDATLNLTKNSIEKDKAVMQDDVFMMDIDLGQDDI